MGNSQPAKWDFIVQVEPSITTELFQNSGPTPTLEGQYFEGI